MHITVAKIGKDQFMNSKDGIHKSKMIILNIEESIINKVNTLKLISNVAENPVAREEYKGLLPVLTSLIQTLELEMDTDSKQSPTDDPEEVYVRKERIMFHKAAQVTYEVIIFEP
jgi:hypothetical protein